MASAIHRFIIIQLPLFSFLLFELYVLGLLKDRFGKNVTYHFSRQYNELDYLLNDTEYKMVIGEFHLELVKIKAQQKLVLKLKPKTNQ